MFENILNNKFFFLLLVVVTSGGCFMIISTLYDISFIGTAHHIMLSINPRTSQQSVPVSCPSVLNAGRFQKYDQWEPYGCTLHNYSKEDARVCVQHGMNHGIRDRIVMIGNSRVRYLYDTFTDFFSYNKTHIKAHHDLQFENDIILDFKWEPLVTQLKSSLQTLSALPRDKRPTLIVAASSPYIIGPEHGPMKQGDVVDYIDNLKSLTPYITELQITTTLIWMIQARLNDTIFKVRAPVAAAFMTNEKFDIYNNAANKTLKSGPFQIWYSGRDIAEGFIGDMTDGIHVTPRVNYWYVQILLNMYCNHRMTNITATCCKTANKISAHQIHFNMSAHQIIVAGIFVICLWTTVCCIIQRREQS